MKKMLSFILMLAIVLLPASAIAAPGDAILLRQGVDGYASNVISMAEVDGTLYILTYDGLYTLESGETEPVKHTFALNSTVEDDGEGGSISCNVIALVPYGGQPCLIASETAMEVDGLGEDAEVFSTVEGVWLYTLEIGGDGSAAPGGKLVELDWFDIVQGNGDTEYVAQCSMATVMDGMLYCLSYDESYERILVATSLEDGGTDVYYPADFGEDLYMHSFCAYKDGKLLTANPVWSEADGQYVSTFYAIDVEKGEAEALFTLPPEDYTEDVGGLAYRADTDTLYYIMNGELHAVTGMDVSTLQSVAAIPVDNVDAVAPVLTADGYYIAADYEMAVRRSTDPSQRAQTRITVQDVYNTSINNANYAFANTHGDVEVIMNQQVGDVVQAMMNRSADVDIYCFSVDTAEYEAVFSRGYMAELSGSGTIKALLDNCYPFIQEVCEKDGEIVGVPVEMYMDCRGYDPEAFARLGLTEEDVPTTWAGFFASLEPLAGKAAEEPGMALFEGFSDSETARLTLLSLMVTDYMNYLSQPEHEFAFDTEAFRSALAAYEAVDWTALGLPEPDADDGFGTVVVGSTGFGGVAEHNFLYTPYTSVSANSYTARSDFRPLLLGFAEGEQPQISATLYVAFVNPFSGHRDAAIAFLETVAEEMDALTRIQFCPEENEPVRSPYYENNLAAFDQSIADAEALLEAAQTDEEKQAYEEMLGQYRQYREEFLEYDAWTASEESIALYREDAPYIRVVRNIGMGSENSEEFYDLEQQYMDGMISADEFIRGVDSKLQMMVKEGM